MPLPPIAYSHTAHNGTIVHYTPEHIPWYIDQLGRVLIKDSPYGYRIIGQMPAVPYPHQGHPSSMAYSGPGPSPAFVSTSSRRGGRNRTSKKKSRNNNTLKK
jgi:hypothetical protein